MDSIKIKKISTILSKKYSTTLPDNLLQPQTTLLKTYHLTKTLFPLNNKLNNSNNNKTNNNN